MSERSSSDFPQLDSRVPEESQRSLGDTSRPYSALPSPQPTYNTQVPYEFLSGNFGEPSFSYNAQSARPTSPAHLPQKFNPVPSQQAEWQPNCVCSPDMACCQSPSCANSHARAYGPGWATNVMSVASHPGFTQPSFQSTLEKPLVPLPVCDQTTEAQWYGAGAPIDPPAHSSHSKHSLNPSGAEVHRLPKLAPRSCVAAPPTHLSMSTLSLGPTENTQAPQQPLSEQYSGPALSLAPPKRRGENVKCSRCEDKKMICSRDRRQRGPAAVCMGCVSHDGGYNCNLEARRKKRRDEINRDVKTRKRRREAAKTSLNAEIESNADVGSKDPANGP